VHYNSWLICAFVSVTSDNRLVSGFLLFLEKEEEVFSLLLFETHQCLVVGFTNDN
jgi:hypothetical protein